MLICWARGIYDGFQTLVRAFWEDEVPLLPCPLLTSIEAPFYISPTSLFTSFFLFQPFFVSQFNPCLFGILERQFGNQSIFADPSNLRPILRETWPGVLQRAKHVQMPLRSSTSNGNQHLHCFYQWLEYEEAPARMF